MLSDASFTVKVQKTYSFATYVQDKARVLQALERLQQQQQPTPADSKLAGPSPNIHAAASQVSPLLLGDWQLVFASNGTVSTGGGSSSCVACTLCCIQQQCIPHECCATVSTPRQASMGCPPGAHACAYCESTLHPLQCPAVLPQDIQAQTYRTTVAQLQPLSRCQGFA